LEPQGQRRPAAEFCQLATQPPTGILREFIDFLLQNKKWWLIPIVMAMFLVALMITLGSSGAGPFIYSLY
jgi:hypothetical protein